MKSNIKIQIPACGYTIIEVMIVLAISGVMFLIASTFINGKQEKASFTQGVQDMASNIQNVIEQVQDGQYSDIPVNCKYNPYTTLFPTNTTHQTGVSNGQGTNTKCVFLGKLLDFGHDSSVPTPVFTYKIYTLVGGRLDANGNPLIHLNANYPNKSGNIENADPRSVDTLTQIHNNPQSLYVRDIWVKDSTSGVVNADPGFNSGGTPANPKCVSSWTFGFFEPQSSPDSISIQYLWSWGNNGLTYGQNSALDNRSQLINSPGLGGGGMFNADWVQMRVTDGVQFADIIIGDNNNQISVNIKMDGSAVPSPPPPSLCTYTFDELLR
ncbi:MAG TPA: type II secretion system protein [Candidatus Saccharimonadales bacterium]|nr:type II secretion system protein [Candidatus Saccharimonadales bacterium]